MYVYVYVCVCVRAGEYYVIECTQKERKYVQLLVPASCIRWARGNGRNVPIDRRHTASAPQPQHGKHTAEIGTHASTCGGMNAQHCTRAGQSLLLHTDIQYHVRNIEITVIPGLDVDRRYWYTERENRNQLF